MCAGSSRSPWSYRTARGRWEAGEGHQIYGVALLAALFGSAVVFNRVIQGLMVRRVAVALKEKGCVYMIYTWYLNNIIPVNGHPWDIWTLFMAPD